MPAPLYRVWPVVSDTHAFNRAVGVGPWTFAETPDSIGGSQRVGTSRSLGKKITWDEMPFHWVEGREFRVNRANHNGPFLNVLSHLELEPAAEGTGLTYHIEAVPRSFLWSIIARYYLGVQTRRRFDRVFGNIARYLAGDAEEVYPGSAPRLSGAGRNRLRSAESSLVQAGLRQGLVETFARYIGAAPDDACHRIKPFALADAWGEDRETVLSLCLHATRLGLLELTWDVMCPQCRGAKDRHTSLGKLRRESHCSSCNIQFDANFDRSVEVTFRPSVRIRRLEEASYCVGGPRNTPHVVLQQSVSAGTSVTLPLDLTEGTYRLRGPQISASALLEVSPSHPDMPTTNFSFSREEVMPERVELAPGENSVRIQNSGEHEFLVLLERMVWPEDAVTAARITAMQDFRDLFSSEVLAPEEGFQVRYLTFMFTDLRSSTVLYQEKGDAPAYALVRDHFQVLRECISRNHGAVVKTIGDAVMAVFREPADAVVAGLEIHNAFNSAGDPPSSLVLKIGVHAGPTIAVNLNGTLDYFGTTVNTAVRLESHSLGGDLVVRSDLLDDPLVRDLVARPGIRTEQHRAQLKGFSETVEICRIHWEGDKAGKG